MMIIRVLSFIVLIAVIAVNALANILPINDITTGGVSAIYDNYFTPAGFTFSIWSIIYLGLMAFCIYQLVSKNFRDNEVNYWFILNGIANMLWIITWHYEYLPLTMLIMLVILYSLYRINICIRDESLWVKVPFQIYFGWICVATIANAAALLVYLNWNRFGLSEMYWGIILVAIAGILAFVMTLHKRLILSSLTIAWGLFGIYMQQVFLERAVTYQTVCVIVIALILGTTIFTSFRPKLN